MRLIKYSSALLFGLCLLLSPVLLCGQNLTGEIDGSVRDATGAYIPNASVTITNTETNLVVRTLESDSQGQFAAPALVTGAYRVTVTSPGFQSVTVSAIQVNANLNTPLQITLPLGKANQTVSVTADQLVPDTQTAANGTLLSGTQVRELSLSSRNYEQLVQQQPGITGSVPGTLDRGQITSAGASNSASFQVSGLGTSSNQIYLDGSDIVARGAENQTVVFPSVDAVQSMTLLRANYGAQYGGSGSAVISMQTRAGTAQFHGGAFDFFRSQVLDANGYFNNLAKVPRPGIRYQDYGYDLGGPVQFRHFLHPENPKTFFFFLQEFLREETQSGETLTNIPSAAQLQGNFSAPVCTLYNATNTTCLASSTSISSIDATAAAYIKDIFSKEPPLNNPSDPQGLITSAAGFNNETQTVIRIDHQFSNKLSAFFRYLNDPYNLVVPNGLYGTSSVPGVAVSNVQNGGPSYLGYVTFMPSSSWIIAGGYSHGSAVIDGQPTGLLSSANSPDIHPKLPYVSALSRVPDVVINGFSYSAYGPYFNADKTDQAFVNVTHTQGRQTLYFGGVYERAVSGSTTGLINAGHFQFAAGPRPAGSAATVYMQSFADFLLGDVSTFTQTNIDPANLATVVLQEYYLQDDIAATPRLKVNLGVRYSYFPPGTVDPYQGSNEPGDNIDLSLYQSSQAPTIGSTGLICTASPCPGGGRRIRTITLKTL